jgi:putative intracellular protease/amidase/YHS domain-containing protein
MKRRDLLGMSTSFGLAVALQQTVGAEVSANPSARRNRAAEPPNPLEPPDEGEIPVAFLISDDAAVIDFAGPWEVFSDVYIPGRVPQHPFRLYTVAETTNPVRVSGGMTVTPNYSLISAPPPKVIVIPAQSEPGDRVLDWVRKASKTTNVTMSVCTGAFLLARTGLLSGKAATTHHGAYAEFEMTFPDVRVKRGARFVEAGNLASSGGLSAGIDLALRVVERYFGQAVASSTAYNLEYQGLGWMDPDSNAEYARARISTAAHPVCAVCQMDVDSARAPKSTFRRRTYYFCMEAHKKLFEANPGRFAAGE